MPAFLLGLAVIVVPSVALLSDTEAVPDNVITFEEGGADPDGWWDPDWTRRQRINVDASAVAAPDGYTMTLVIDHAALVAEGLSLASGDDVRVVLELPDGTLVELDRVLAEGSSWGSSTTTIEFRTRRPVAATTRDDGYWLYTANPAAGTPPTDPRQVYAFDDDFEDGTLTQFTEVGQGAWYAADPWTWRAPVTIPAGAVDADLTDLPVLVRATPSGLAGVAQPDGSDLRFTDSSGTPLDHELVAYDASTGAVEAWVRVPSVPAASSTQLWLYAGAPDAPAQQDVRGTWGTEHLGVWHLAGDPSARAPQQADSGRAGRDGVVVGGAPAGARTTGRVGEAMALDGTDDGVRVGDVRGSSQGLTVAAWIRADATTGDPVVAARGAGVGDVSWAFALDRLTASTAALSLTLDLAGTPTTVAAGSIPTGSWRHVAAVFDGGSVVLYVDGVVAGGSATSGLRVAGDGHEVVLGQLPDGSRTFDGTLDEVVVVDGARSPAWVAAQHAMGTGGFATVGAGQTGTWFGQGEWAARLPLTVDAGRVASDLTDFPVLIQLTDASLRDLARADGADLVVTAEDGTTRLDHELDGYDPGTGTARLWVRVPDLSSTVDTQLFLYHGNSSASDQQDPEAVWGPDARAVLHLGEDPSG